MAPKRKKMASKTRSSDKPLMIIGETITPENRKITGSRLPSKKQVLMSYLSFSNELKTQDSTRHNKIARPAAKQVVSEVLPHYEKAGIRTIQEHKMAEKIEALFKEYENVRKLNNDRKHAKVIEFKNDLEETMQFWPRNTIQEMEKLLDRRNILENERTAIQEDINFLKSMQTDRKASYTGRDTRYEQIVNARQERRSEKASLSREPVPTDTNMCQFGEMNDSADSSESDEDFTFVKQTDRRQHRRTKSGVDLHIPPDILKNELIQSTAIRNKVTPTALSAVVHSIVSACNSGDTSGIYLHHTQAYR